MSFHNRLLIDTFSSNAWRSVGRINCWSVLTACPICWKLILLNSLVPFLPKSKTATASAKKCINNTTTPHQMQAAPINLLTVLTTQTTLSQKTYLNFHKRIQKWSDWHLFKTKSNNWKNKWKNLLFLMGNWPFLDYIKSVINKRAHKPKLTLSYRAHSHRRRSKAFGIQWSMVSQ